MRLLDYFQQVYVINLPHRHDRRREMARQLESIGIGFDTPGVRLFAATRPEDRGEFENIGARGCFLSHLGVLKDAKDRGFERIAIFEDDFDFRVDFDRHMAEAIAELERADWSLFYGGYEMNPEPRPEGGHRIVQAAPSAAIQTAHFVCFRAPAIAAVVEFLEAMLTRPAGDPRGGPMHVDGAYSWFRARFPSNATFVAALQLGAPRSSATDIHALRWFDRWMGVRQVARWVRRMRNASRRRFALAHPSSKKVS